MARVELWKNSGLLQARKQCSVDAALAADKSELDILKLKRQVKNNTLTTDWLHQIDLPQV